VHSVGETSLATVHGAKTLSIMTFGITTLGITTFSIIGWFVTLSIYDTQHNNA
jgi:hypothetical protein